MTKKEKRPNKIIKKVIFFPMKLIEPIRYFLHLEEKKLRKRKKELMKTDPFRERSRLIDNAAPDTDANEQLGHERTMVMKTQIDRRLIQLRKALMRIKIGKYGICEKCGKMIDTDRLMVMPEATICIECEKKKEK